MSPNCLRAERVTASMPLAGCPVVRRRSASDTADTLRAKTRSRENVMPAFNSSTSIQRCSAAVTRCAAALLAALAFASPLGNALAQGRPSVLAPNRDSAAPGATVSIAVVPALSTQ